MKEFLVDQTSIQNYPEIVLALQGVCFEDGVFLHYQMAKMFHEDNIRYVYTGDLADQVFDLEIYQYTKETWKRIFKLYYRGIKLKLRHNKYDFYKGFFRGRYETAALKLLKKSGQMWGYFGAEGIYPYTRRAFLSMAKSTSIPGDYSKRFHRKAVLATVDPEVAEKIKRTGGNTDPVALFDERTKSILKKEIAKMPWYKPRIYMDENETLGYELRVLYIDLVRRIFIEHEYDRTAVGQFPLLEDFYPAFGKQAQ